MSEKLTVKDPTPLVKSVLALDDYFAELKRVGTKVTEMELKSEFDFDHAQRLLNRFAECGEGVATEVTNLSNYLTEARTSAEAVAQAVSARAETIHSHKGEEQKKFEEFKVLGDKVAGLSAALVKWKRSVGEQLTNEEKAELTASLAEFNEQLTPLIDQAQSLRKEAQESKMKTLAQNADSLTQTLQAIRQKLGTVNLSATT